MTVVDFSKLHFGDGKHFDRLYENRIDDRDFYVAKVSEFGDPVLELGSGTGRIALSIAADGMRVTGVELLQSMAFCAQEKAIAKTIEWTSVVADFREAKLDKHKTIIGPFNFLGNFTLDAELAIVIKKVNELLEKSGHFIFDVGNPLSIQRRAKGEIVRLGEYADPHTNERIVLSAQSELNFATRTQKIIHHYLFCDSGRTVSCDFELRAFWPEDIPRILRANGFVSENIFGDFSGAEFNETSKFQIVVASKVK